MVKVTSGEIKKDANLLRCVRGTLARGGVERSLGSLNIASMTASRTQKETEPVGLQARVP